MKKVILALMLTLFMTTGVLAQQLIDGFETWPSPNWNLIETSPINPITQSLLKANSGTYSLRFNSYSRADSYDQYIVSNELNWTDPENEFSFYHSKDTFGTERIVVGWSTSGDDVEDDFTWGAVIELTENWTQYIKTDLPANTKYVAIHYLSNYEYYCFIDDIVLGNPLSSSPDAPILVSPAHNAINVSIDSDLAWTLSPNTYDPILYLADNPEFSYATIVDDAVSPYSRYLYYDTTYYWKVVCSGDTGQPIENVNVWSFTTAPDPTIHEYPFEEGFEENNIHNSASIYGWTQDPELAETPWTINETDTDYNRAPRGGEYNVVLGSGGTAWLMRPVEVQAGREYEVEIYARQDGADSTSASIGIYYAAGERFTEMMEITDIVGVVGGDYQLIRGTFIPQWSGTYQIGIRGEIYYNAYYLSIDDFRINEVEPIYPEFIDFPDYFSLIRNSKQVINVADYVSYPEHDLSMLELYMNSASYDITYAISGLELTIFAPEVWTGYQTWTLGVVNPTNGAGTIQRFGIEIVDSFQVGIETDRTEILAGETIEFWGFASGNPNSWAWYLNNDDIIDSYEQNPTFTYNESGVYTIGLIVSHIDENQNIIATESVYYEDYITVTGTQVTGGTPVTGTWEVDLSPYNVFGEISVEEGASFEIEDGTVVNFMDDNEFVIEGDLIANNVTFGSAGTGAQGPGSWQGLRFTPSSGNSTLTNCTIMNASTAIELNNASPILTGLTLNGDDGLLPAIIINGSSNALLNGVTINNYGTGIEVLGDNSDDVPTLTNITIQHSTRTSYMRIEDEGTAIKIQDSNAILDDIDIQDFAKGIEIKSTSDDTIPTITNIRIRHTTNTSRTEDGFALRVEGNSSPIINDVEIEDFPKAIIFDALNSSETIPTLTNIRIRHTTNTSRELGGKALEFVGSVSPHLTEVIVEDYLTGISFDNTNRSGETIPTLTNIRIRHTTNTSRTEAVALKSTGKVNMVVTDFESEDVKNGISIYSDEETIPTLTNIRIRHTTNTSRELGGTGIELNGLIQAVIDDVEIVDFVTGISLENITRTEEAIPTLTNIRIRHTTNTSRTDAIALKSVGFINLNLTDFESENVKDGINIYANEETIPTLTNIRIRHTTNTSRNIGVGLTLNAQTNIVLTNSLIEGFATGLKINGNNSSIIQRNALINNQVAIELSGEDCLPQIHHNYIENSLTGAISCFAMSNIGNIQILNNNILGYASILTGEYSSPYFSQNIMWDADITANQLASGNQVNASFDYNDISMPTGLAPGIGNINIDPLFIEGEASHDLALSIYSPCIDAGNPNLAPDLDGSVADIGMNYVHHLVQYNSTYRFGTTGTEVQFTNKSEGHDDPLTTILWDFGDGNTSNERNPLHNYENVGLNNVTLTMVTGSYTDVLYRENFVIAQPNVLNAPQNPAVTIIGNGINLTWEEITETIFGNPITNLTYLIYSCADLTGIYEYRANVANLTWTDQNIAQRGDRQFYFIIGYSSTGRTSLEEYINTHRFMRRNGEVILLHGSKK